MYPKLNVMQKVLVQVIVNVMVNLDDNTLIGEVMESMSHSFSLNQSDSSIAKTEIIHYDVIQAIDVRDGEGFGIKVEVSPRDKFINEFEARILDGLTGDRLSTKVSTCDYPNWSIDEYQYMPTVAERLRAKGYTVSSKINHGVTDWYISK